MAVIEKVHLVKSDPVKNNNKFWIAELHDDDMVHCSWGRVGATNFQSNVKAGGKKFLDSKVKSKMRDGRNGEIGYRKVDIIDGGLTTSSNNIKNSSLEQLATNQIETGGNKTALNLIKYLVKVNAHQISSMTGGQITFDYSAGLFQTPMGLVSQASIDEARIKLTGIGNFVANNDYRNGLMDLTRDYLMLVPQNFGRQRLELSSFWGDISAVQKQDAILDGLQASLTQSSKGDKKVNFKEEQVFQTKMELVEDPQVVAKIKKLYNSTRKKMHTSYGLDVKKIYTVDINTVSSAFQKDGAKMDNIWDLWHGSRASNLLSILKGGLIIPPSNASNVTGRMFSNGIYASDQSTKALNYAQGSTWGNGPTDNNCFMLLIKMAMGNYHIPSGPSQNLPYRGSNSTFAKAHKSGVFNNEMIVYKTSQIDLRYLVEFSPNGK